MAIENALKLLVEVLYRQRAQLVNDAAYLHPVVGVWVRSTLWCDQDAACDSAVLMQRGIGLGGIAQDEVSFGR